MSAPVRPEPGRPAAEILIPHPPEKPIIGNLMDLGSATQVQDMMKLEPRLAIAAAPVLPQESRHRQLRAAAG
ncbi:MAG TPA: hypothetical protein VMT85_13745 [Thermoanaerobaculia bacterium]|nr:hypothetical protein [Thermoanaerobaculia bacterium]